MTTTKSQTRIELQPRDLDMLAAIFDLRYATGQQVATLFPSEASQSVIRGQFRSGAEAIARRLAKLAKHGYLSRLGLPHRLSHEAQVYTLHKRGAQTLESERGFDAQALNEELAYVRKYLSSRSDKRPYLQHRLGINTFRIALVSALRGHPKAAWLCTEGGRPYWVEPHARDETFRVTIKRTDVPAVTKLRLYRSMYTLTRAPDALFILRPDRNSKHSTGFIYEKDRGTEALSRVARKLLCYYHWHKQKRHHRAFATEHLRVLVETESAARLKNMIERLAFEFGKNGSGIFWFTTTDQVTLNNPQGVLENIWVIGHRNHFDPAKPLAQQTKHSLLEFTPPEAQEEPSLPFPTTKTT